MQVDYGYSDFLITIVLVVLLVIITFGLSYFIPTIARELINRFKKQ